MTARYINLHFTYLLTYYAYVCTCICIFILVTCKWCYHLRRPCGIEYCGCVCVCFMLILMFCSFACKIYEYEYSCVIQVLSRLFFLNIMYMYVKRFHNTEILTFFPNNVINYRNWTTIKYTYSQRILVLAVLHVTFVETLWTNRAIWWQML